MLQTCYKLNPKIIYLSIALVSSTSPPELSLVAFFFKAFKLDFFNRFLKAFLGAGLVGVLVSNLLSRK